MGFSIFARLIIQNKKAYCSKKTTIDLAKITNVDPHQSAALKYLLKTCQKQKGLKIKPFKKNTY